MNQKEWQTSDKALDMLAYAREWTSDRKLRLFVCALARAIWSDMDGENRLLVRCSENQPDTTIKVAGAGWGAVFIDIERGASLVGDMSHCLWATEKSLTRAGQADLVRELVPDPFVAVSLAPLGEHWRKQFPEVLSLADAAWKEQGSECPTCKGAGDSASGLNLCAHCNGKCVLDDGQLSHARLAILADALEEAGCTDQQVLSHLRSEPTMCWHCEGRGWFEDDSASIEPRIPPFRATCERCRGDGVLPACPRYRGCWALDLVRGER
jgi:hypothetical protein